MPNPVKTIIKLSDPTFTENSLALLNSYHSLVYFWHKSSVEIANIADNLWEHVLNVSYAGRSPYAIAEYFDSYLQNIPNLRNWAAKSHTIHDYFEPNYFPVNSVIADLSENSVREILLHFGAQQAVILDIDSAKEGSIYTYNFSQGLQEQSINSENGRNDKQSVDHKFETYAKARVEEIFTPGLIRQIEQILEKLSDQPTLWLLSGESVAAANYNIFELIARIFGTWQQDLPTINYFAIDKYQILNFLSKFSQSFLKINFGLLFNLLPLTIVNTTHLPDKKTISVMDRKEVMLKVDKITLLKSVNIAYYHDEKTLFGIKNYLTLPGVVWYWRPKEIDPLKATLLIDSFPQKRVLSKVNLNYDLLGPKQVLWKLALPSGILRKLSKQKKITLGNSKIVTLPKYHFQLISDKDFKNLKVTSGQKVAIGEPLLGAKDHLKAVATGNIYLKKGNTSYLKLRSIQNSKKDIAWLETTNCQLVKIGRNDIVIKINALVRPVSRILGCSYSGVLTIVESYAEARVIAENVAGVIIAINHKLNTNEIWRLIEAGCSRLVLPDLPNDFSLPFEIEQELSIVATSIGGATFSSQLYRLLLEKQGTEVFIDQITNELKFQIDTRAIKFPMEKQKLPQEFLTKGTRVLTLRSNNYLQEASIHHKEGKALFLKQVNVQRLLQEDIENVTLI